MKNERNMSIADEEIGIIVDRHENEVISVISNVVPVEKLTHTPM